MAEDKLPLFDVDKRWEEEWKDMPEFDMSRIKPILIIKMNFVSKEDIEKFEQLIGQKITPSVKNYWFPKRNMKTVSDMVYVDEP